MEILCWGWINGVKRSLGNQAHLQRTTSRMPKSRWSKRHVEHTQRLIADGKI